MVDNHHLIKTFFKFLEDKDGRKIPIRVKSLYFFDELSKSDISRLKLKGELYEEEFSDEYKIIRLYVYDYDNGDKIYYNIVDSNNKLEFIPWVGKITKYSNHLLTVYYNRSEINLYDPIAKKMVFDKNFLDIYTIQSNPVRAIIRRFFGINLKLYNLIDEFGNELLDEWYSRIEKINDSPFLFASSRKSWIWTVIDRNGRLISGPYNQTPKNFNVQLGDFGKWLLVGHNSKFNLISRNDGQIVLDNWFDKVSDEKLTSFRGLIGDQWYDVDLFYGTIRKS